MGYKKSKCSFLMDFQRSNTTFIRLMREFPLEKRQFNLQKLTGTLKQVLADWVSKVDALVLMQIG